jgi:hypothetical protein
MPISVFQPSQAWIWPQIPQTGSFIERWTLRFVGVGGLNVDQTPIADSNPPPYEVGEAGSHDPRNDHAAHDQGRRDNDVGVRKGHEGEIKAQQRRRGLARIIPLRLFDHMTTPKLSYRPKAESGCQRSIAELLYMSQSACP